MVYSIIIIIIMLSYRNLRAQLLSVSSLLKGISWSQRVSNLVGHSFCEHIGIARRALDQLSYQDQ